MSLYDGISLFFICIVSYAIIGTIVGCMSYFRTKRWYKDYVNNGGDTTRQKFNSCLSRRSAIIGLVWPLIFKGDMSLGIFSTSFYGMTEVDRREFVQITNTTCAGLTSYRID